MYTISSGHFLFKGYLETFYGCLHGLSSAKNLVQPLQSVNLGISKTRAEVGLFLRHELVLKHGLRAVCMATCLWNLEQ